MIKDYRSLIGASVLEFDSGEPLATVSGIIVNPDSGMVEAFWVKSRSLNLKSAILKASDIVEFKKNLYVKSDKVFAQAEDVIRINEILEDGRSFLGSTIQNEAGDSYGNCVNLDFDTKTFALKQIHSKKAFLGFFVLDQRIFTYNNIIKVLPGLILINDDSSKKESLIVSTPEAAAG